MSRIDYFLIWGEGHKYDQEILSLIRNDSNFRIITIIKKHPNMPVHEFVRKVYECDHVPIEHLESKYKYLLNYSTQVTLVLVENKDPDERYYGEGAFRHIQCRKVIELKRHIRELYNPRDTDGKITYNHVVHASDYESQVDHLLKVLKLPSVADFCMPANKNFISSPFMNKFDKYEIRDVNINDLYVKELGRGYKFVFESYAYNYVTGMDKESYKDYWLRHWGIYLIEDHSPEAFDKLIKRYEYHPDDEKNLIIVKQYQDKYLICDGVHRASILYNNGITNIRVVVIQ